MPITQQRLLTAIEHLEEAIKRAKILHDTARDQYRLYGKSSPATALENILLLFEISDLKPSPQAETLVEIEKQWYKLTRAKNVSAARYQRRKRGLGPPATLQPGRGLSEMGISAKMEEVEKIRGSLLSSEPKTPQEILDRMEELNSINPEIDDIF